MGDLSFEILDCETGHLAGTPGYYRILVDSSTIKYLSFQQVDLTFPDIYGERLAFSTVPGGNWNVGYLVQDPGNKKFALQSTDTIELKSIQKTWHPAFVDWRDLSEPVFGALDGELQCQGQIHSAVFPGHFGHEFVVIGYDWYPHDIYGSDHESEIYALLDGHNITPKFLAHVTQNRDRVIGNMVQRIPGRAATVDDYPACQAVLSKLHALDIAHGGLCAEVFIVCDDGVFLQGFQASYQTNNKSILDQEMDSLRGKLKDGWTPPGRLNEELNNQLMAILKRDGGLHPDLLHKAYKEGQVTITESKHKQMPLQLRAERPLAQV